MAPSRATLPIYTHSLWLQLYSYLIRQALCKIWYSKISAVYIEPETVRQDRWKILLAGVPYTGPDSVPGINLTASSNDLAECPEHIEEAAKDYKLYISMEIVLRAELKFETDSRSTGFLAGALVEYHKKQTQAAKTPEYHRNCNCSSVHQTMLRESKYPNSLECTILYTATPPPLSATNCEMQFPVHTTISRK